MNRTNKWNTLRQDGQVKYTQHSTWNMVNMQNKFLYYVLGKKSRINVEIDFHFIFYAQNVK